MDNNIQDLHELVADFNDYIKRVEAGSVTIANLLRENETKSALNSISSFVEGMNWLIVVSKHLKEHKIDTTFNEQKVITYFEEINEGLSVQDYFLVADLFEYEIATYFQELPLISIES